MLEAEIGRADSLFTVSSLGALTTSALASLDGGINVNDNVTVSTAGAIAGATTVGASGLITGGGLTDGTATIAAGGRFWICFSL